MIPVWSAWSVLTALVMLALIPRVVSFRRRLGRLRDEEAQSDRGDWPKVSLIVPACNEVETISSAARTLLAMDYPNLELILIDDRSTDGTDAVIRSLAALDARVKAVYISELPAGWLGKLRALHRGVLAASGEWLLFTDADVHFGVHSLRKAIGYCEKRGLDFLSLAPSFVRGSFAARLIIAQFMHFGSISIEPGKVEDPRYRDCVGAGAFNLVKRSGWEKTGGFEWLKMEVMDDGGIAYGMKESGARCAVLSGLGEIELEWYPTFPAFARGLEKNGFALFEYSLRALLIVLAGFLVFAFGFSLAPWLSGNTAVMFFTWGGLFAYLCAAAYALPSAMRISPFAAFLFPFTFVLIPIVILRAAVICLRQQGIYWRGTLYPLSALRAGQRVKVSKILLNRKFK